MTFIEFANSPVAIVIGAAVGCAIGIGIGQLMSPLLFRILDWFDRR